MNPPKISVITACLNRAGMVSTAIESVLAQDYPDFEHIIVDGGSTDGTLDVLGRYHHLKVISEPDHGMYDALNKGLKLAQGEIAGFLNSDDSYAPGVFKEVISIFSNAEVEAVAGRAEVFREDQAGKFETLSQANPPSPDNLLERTILSNAAFNAWFFQRNIFGRIGAFNSEYRIVGDQEFMIRLALAGIRFARTDRLIYQYRRHGGALTFNWNGAFFSDIVQEHLKMTDGFLGKVGLTNNARKYLQKLRTRDTIVMAIFLLRRWKVRKAGFYVNVGMRSDWKWPLKFVCEVFSRLTHPRLRQTHQP
jgi:glycosyltransferase involved in cell wall biosynthesis